jgi:DNA-directed RNA polymerase specialized sigma24 family protein
MPEICFSGTDVGDVRRCREEETARSMGIRRGTVKSATSRALAALGQRM